MNISITPELEKLVHTKVASGMYNSASEVIREALRLLAERDELQRQRIAAMDAFIQEGMDSAGEDAHLTPEEKDAKTDAFWAELDAIIAAAENKHA